jgi:glycosyltransferase involved in cell wall biosynthesis
MGAPIRVLYLQPAAHFGGAERQAATIVPLLCEFGVDALPVVGPGREIVSWLRERGVTEYVHSDGFPGGWTKPRGLAKLALPWRYLRCMQRFRAELAELIREHEIDVVFAAMAYSWIAATPVARRFGVPIVWRAGGTECSGPERKLLAAWARWNKPDWLVCNGDAVQQFYGPLVGAPSTVIRNGLDARQFCPRPERAALRPPHARCVIGFAGRLVPQKRPEDFIAVAARLAARDDIAFLLAGDGSRRPHYSDLARRVGARTVQVTGFLHDMRAFYAACDVLVLPSRSEGCPNVVLEAMAMGTAVVAADAPATREIVTDLVDGILYPVGAVDALCGVLGELVDDPDRRRMLAARGLQRVRQLTARDCAARTAALLREIARDRSRPLLPAAVQYTELRA